MADETDQDQERLQAQAHRLAASMTEPVEAPDLPKARPLSSTQSESNAAKEVLNLVVQRVDQVARLNQEQWQRSEGTLKQMQETMRLAQVMIGQQDELQEAERETLLRLESAISSLVKVTANLTQIMAELLSPSQAG